jgi:hypothetical protein
MKDPELCDMDDDPGIVELDELRNGHLLSLSKSNNNYKGGYAGKMKETVS